MQASTAIAEERSGGTDMRRSIAMLLCFFPTLVSQSAGATSYLVYRKFEPGCDDQSKRCSHYRCSSAHMDFPRDIPPACQRSFEPRIFGAVAFAGRIDPPDSESHRQSSAVSRVAQTDTAKPNPPEGPPTKETAPAPGYAAIAKWHKALLGRLARYNRYPAQANSAEGVVSLAFTVDRKGNVVTSRIEKTSGSNVLDAEALALLARAAPFPAPPPEVADADLTFILPVRFCAGDKH
jgi:TonB family protein